MRSGTGTEARKKRREERRVVVSVSVCVRARLLRALPGADDPLNLRVYFLSQHLPLNAHHPAKLHLRIDGEIDRIEHGVMGSL